MGKTGFPSATARWVTPQSLPMTIPACEIRAAVSASDPVTARHAMNTRCGVLALDAVAALEAEHVELDPVQEHRPLPAGHRTVEERTEPGVGRWPRHAVQIGDLDEARSHDRRSLHEVRDGPVDGIVVGARAASARREAALRGDPGG